MNVETFAEILGAEFYTGVPDSRLRPFCDYLMETCGIDAQHHITSELKGRK